MESIPGHGHAVPFIDENLHSHSYQDSRRAVSNQSAGLLHSKKKLSDPIAHQDFSRVSAVAMRGAALQSLV